MLEIPDLRHGSDHALSGFYESVRQLLHRLEESTRAQFRWSVSGSTVTGRPCSPADFAAKGSFSSLEAHRDESTDQRRQATPCRSLPARSTSVQRSVRAESARHRFALRSARLPRHVHSEADWQAFLVSQTRLNDELATAHKALERRRLLKLRWPLLPSRATLRSSPTIHHEPPETQREIAQRFLKSIMKQVGVLSGQITGDEEDDTIPSIRP